jgi:amino acid adenylation domain-containing protein
MSKAAGRDVSTPEDRRTPRVPGARRRDPESSLVHRQIERQAVRTPLAVAVGRGDVTLTYAELDRRADRLASRLRRAGVGPESLVGLCVGRSPGLVVGLLAVLKAGAAYLPLDPALPEARLSYMVADAGLTLLLTEPDQADRLPAGPAPVLGLDEDPEQEQAPEGPGDRAAVSVPVSAENLAYVIYTSGSTGRPKGVQVSHGALANFLGSMRRLTAIGPGDALLAVTTLSFDIAVLELLLPLTVGARVELVGREQAGDGAWLAGRLSGGGITHFQATPATWRMLLESGWAGDPGLTLLCGGEAMDRGLADRLCGLGKAAWNLYGPTETTVWSSAWAVQAGSGPVSIGRPIARTRLYVLDRGGRPAPVGVAGELHIGGAGLARGYLGRAGLTAERFVPDPFGEEGGSRLYRTGDVARWRADGSLECLGRVDHQVKVRGFRVELGEVEAALGSHPGVGSAASWSWLDGSGERSLAGYVVGRGGASAPGSAELRGWLLGRLPEYMIPTWLVELAELPLTPNGKVDRNALPDPVEAARLTPVGEFVPPRGAAEEAIAEAWAAVLGRDRVGATDDFFELGGHSLLATQVMSRLRDSFGVEIPLRALFESPTVAGLAGRIETIRVGSGRRDAIPIGAGARVGPQPLSFAQEALWLLHQLAPDQPTFNITAAVRVAGSLEIPALGQAVDELVRRHESLRTTFEVIDGRPVQVLAPGLELVPDLADLTGLPPGDREAEAGRRASEEARRPFDLGRGPLARMVVLRLGERDHAVLLTMHHIMTDGWSFGVAAGELSALYEAFRQGRPSPLPGLPIQYADFARWQRERRQGADWADQVEVWRRRLAGVPALELATDRPRPPVRSMRGALRPFSLPAGLSEAVRELGRREGLTPFMTLLSAFQIVLSRWSGQDDFAVGSPVANRTRAETEGLIGYFVNMLALRADLSGDPTALDYLARVREVALEAFEHQEIPLEVLIESLGARREPGRTPLFQVMFVLQNNAMPDVDATGLSLTPLDQQGAGTGTAKFELTLALTDSPGGFLGSVEYSVDLFDEATIERLTRHYETALAAMVADPGRRLSRLPLLDEAGRRLVAEEWSQSPEPTANPLPLHERFEALVRATPGAVALVAGDGRYTYDELNRRANRLAHHLIALGVGPESRVALVLDRAPSRLAALLGVLKAGGAYVPLDPGTPRERLGTMLADAGASVAIAESGGLDDLPGAAPTIVDLDRAGPELEARVGDDPGVAVAGANLAYVIYTSGSTGRPKGVLVTHASLASAATAWADAYGLRDGPMPHLQAAPFAFDVFTGDWARALCSGGSLVACPRETLLDPPALVDLLRRERVGCAELVPAVAEAMAGELERQGGGLPGLRLLAVGSDTLRAGLYGRLRRLVGPGCRVVNSYGLTESTIDSSFFEGPVPEGDEAADRAVPIGRPFPGTRLYVLDRAMEPSPPGVAGELYVGGSGVARGYASDPPRTAERFLPDPFGPAGGRLYRTGDRARWAAGGVVELIGRLDGQVKVRGHRVELGEVEAALLRHESVREAVVVATPAGVDGVQLAAYVAGPPGRVIAADSVRRALRDQLPRPMIPARIVALDALPRTPAGKVDRDALPPPSPSRDEAFIPPRDDVERQVAAIWEGLLDVRPIGVGDDFFDLGGHSMLAVRLAARIEEEFGRSVPLSALFLSPTIEGLAERLQAPVDEPGRLPLVELGPSREGPRLAMVHPINGGVLCYGPLVRSLGGACDVVGFQAAGLEGEGEPKDDLTRMAGRYVEALLEAQPEGPYLLGGWSMGGVIAFEMARQLTDRGHHVGLLALIDSAAPGPARALDPLDEVTILASYAADMAPEKGGQAVVGADRIEEGVLGALAGGTFDPASFDPAAFGAGLAAQFGLDRLRRHFAVYRANRRAMITYDPAPYRGRALLIQAEESDDFAPAWESLILGGLARSTLPGDHVAIVRRPGVDAVAALLAGAIEAATADGATLGGEAR